MSAPYGHGRYAYSSGDRRPFGPRDWYPAYDSRPYHDRSRQSSFYGQPYRSDRYSSYRTNRHTNFPSREERSYHNSSKNGKSSGESHRVREKEEPKSIKAKDFQYAFIPSDRRAHLRTKLLNRKIASGLSTPPGETFQRSKILTPALIVEEFKKTGHFDIIRKRLLADFQSSEHKKPLLDRLEACVVQSLQDLPAEKRRFLASSDQRLQHSELMRIIEEGFEPAQAVDKLFADLSNTGEEGIAGALADKDGYVGEAIRLSLQEVIGTEKQRIQGATSAEDESGDEDELDASNATTPMIRQSVTPAGRDAPRATPSNSSVGSHTPIFPAPK